MRVGLGNVGAELCVHAQWLLAVVGLRAASSGGLRWAFIGARGRMAA
jgi:hypothetical protein